MGAFGDARLGATAADLRAVTPTRAAGARQTLVDALETVPGLSAGISAPDVATAGAAWPRWVQSTYDAKLCAPTSDQYDVIAVLPGDYATTTVESGDELRDLIEPALWRVAAITYSEPIAVQFNDRQTMPGLRFRVTLR